MRDFQLSFSEMTLIAMLRGFQAEGVNAIDAATFTKWSGESIALVHKRDSGDPQGWWERANG